MLRLLVCISIAILGLAMAPAQAGAPAVSDFAFVMSDTWFVLPGPSPRDDALLFRRYGVAMRKAAFDAVRSGRTRQIELIGQPGTFYNSMIYTCRKVPDKPDYLTFHLPPTVTPASFKYEDMRPSFRSASSPTPDRAAPSKRAAHERR